MLFMNSLCNRDGYEQSYVPGFRIPCQCGRSCLTALHSAPMHANGQQAILGAHS